MTAVTLIGFEMEPSRNIASPEPPLPKWRVNDSSRWVTCSTADSTRFDAAVVQVDEANVTGHLEDGPVATAGINRALEGVTTGRGAVHLCFGNYGGQTIQRGTYTKLAAFLNALEADHVILEIARRPEAELEVFREVKPYLGLGIGVIDIKDNEVETPDEVARRIERAAGRFAPERIVFVHPDCGLWMLPRSVADGKLRALAAGRDRFDRGGAA
jgi:5-methyltetrahydropteroyltriglutamate--homocysteine methyltransferase